MVYYLYHYSFNQISDLGVLTDPFHHLFNLCHVDLFSRQSLPPISRSSLSPFQWKLSPLAQTSMLCLRNRSPAHVVSWNGITLRWPSGRTTPLKVSHETIISMMRLCESIMKACARKELKNFFQITLIPNVLYIFWPSWSRTHCSLYLKTFNFVTFPVAQTEELGMTDSLHWPSLLWHLSKTQE